MRLVSWIGGNDLNTFSDETIKGPIHSTIETFPFTELHFLYNYPEQKVTPYLNWINTSFSKPNHSQYCSLASPIDFNDIYLAADALLSALTQESNEPIGILISPGTPAMQAVWILLGKTKYQVEFFQSSKEQGAQRIEIPFNIAAEFIPEDPLAKKMTELATGKVAIDAAFNDIITQNEHMNELKRKATILAQQEVPVLIYGESGTGKELFATAIHNSSRRVDKPIITVNCGAIPEALIDSAFFGHVKGAFTGATKDASGFFRQADGGTIFLDEFGELKPDVQVRLLRVLQNSEITPIGSSEPIKVDVRVVAATNKDLAKEVAEGRFREDLFYRVAVGVLKLPPLRQRPGDLKLLSEKLLAVICKEFDLKKDKKYSPKALKVILNQEWLGNIRELQSTISRAVLWSTENKLTDADIQQALFSVAKKDDGFLDANVAEGLDLPAMLDKLEARYVREAWQFTQGQKKKTAKLLGLGSYQNLDKRLIKYNIK